MPRSRAAAVLLAAALTAAACSGDSPPEAADAGEETEASDFCEKARALGGGVDIDPQNPDPAEFQRTADDLEELAASAPEEIRDEITSAGQVVREFAELLGRVDLSDPSSLEDPAVQEQLRRLQERDSALGPDLEEIDRFLRAECGIEEPAG